MRIGSLSSVNIEQWTPTYQRTTVKKLIPGFIVAQTYDIVTRNNTLTVKGRLVGTSVSDLATKTMTLRGYATQKKAIWIDASDQYQGYAEFVRILDLEGPTIDANKGILIADFSLKCAMLAPWGTTLTNPFRQSGIVLRDLNGQGAEYMLNPLEFDSNFQINNPNTSSENFSWEFILDNQNPFSGNKLVITQCDDTTNFAGYSGTGITISNDLTIFKQGTASVKVSGTSTTGGALGASFTPSAAQNLSTYDFLVLWIRSDFGGNSSGTISILAGNSGLTSYYQWNYASLTANVWYRLVIPLRHPASTTGTPSLSSIAEFAFQSTGQISVATNMWLDEINVDVGNWVNLEIMMPDNVAQNINPTYNAIQVFYWYSTAYSLCMASDPFGENGQGYSASYLFLDGTEAGQGICYPGSGDALYPVNSIGQTASKNPNSSDSAAASTITYSSAWGTNNRIAIAFKMPPATSDSVSGNYPSNDLSGPMAINKVRIRVQIYVSNEDTSYIGN